MPKVILRSVQYLDREGQTRPFRPGEIVPVSKGIAEEWVRKGLATLLTPSKLGDKNLGLVMRGKVDVIDGIIVSYFISKAIFSERNPLPFDRNLILAPGVRIEQEEVISAAGVLDIWQVACPLVSYSRTCANIGSDADRKRTAEFIPDLRIPYYNTKAIWVKQCPEAYSLMFSWVEEMAYGCEELAFTRALWRVKPLIYTLPYSWVI